MTIKDIALGDISGRYITEEEKESEIERKGVRERKKIRKQRDREKVHIGKRV